MLQLGRLDEKSYAGNVEQRSRCQLVTENSALVQVQSAGAHPNHGLAGLNTDDAVTFLVVIGERSAKRSKNVVDAKLLMIPLVDG